MKPSQRKIGTEKWPLIGVENMQHISYLFLENSTSVMIFYLRVWDEISIRLFRQFIFYNKLIVRLVKIKYTIIYLKKLLSLVENIQL